MGRLAAPVGCLAALGECLAASEAPEAGLAVPVGGPVAPVDFLAAAVRRAVWVAAVRRAAWAVDRACRAPVGPTSATWVEILPTPSIGS